MVKKAFLLSVVLTLVMVTAVAASGVTEVQWDGEGYPEAVWVYLDNDKGVDGRLGNADGDDFFNSILINLDDRGPFDGSIGDENKDKQYDTVWLDGDGDGLVDWGELYTLSETAAEALTNDLVTSLDDREDDDYIAVVVYVKEYLTNFTP
ncbi:MAG: hypothetical protein M3220_16655 [Chloroflexota bacterium]|nr:hypothetical protein [Chloroflexota bacterium]